MIIVENAKVIGPDAKAIIELFDAEKGYIQYDILIDKREAEKDNKSVLVPVSNAIEIVVCHNIRKEPSLEELIKMIRM